MLGLQIGVMTLVRKDSHYIDENPSSHNSNFISRGVKIALLHEEE